MSTVAYFPAVEREDELLDLLSRAGWFLTFSGIERIVVPIADPALAHTSWRVAPGMDPAIAGRFPELERLVELVPVAGEADLEAALEGSAIVLRWRKQALPRWLAPAAAQRLLAGRRVFQVDPEEVRYEGSFYIEVGLALMEDRERVLERSRIRFAALAERIGQARRAYVLATGPSVAEYESFEFEDAVSVACNSVILDRELMRAVQPQILVFADPIFHFGPSEYAASFRRGVVEAAAEFDFTICIPVKYHDVFLAAVPELEERTIALPYTKEREFNFDLSADFELKTTANVLTYLMLPLAATFSDEIGILGCDGRPRSENTYFWSHNKRTQINDKMSNIRAIHPAFFAIDYDDYLDEHYETLEAELRAGEQQGLHFECLAFSHIPPLQRRTREGIASPAPEAAEAGERPLALVLDPDALDWRGHFMAYNDKLAAALELQGAEVKVICNRDLAPEILAERPHFVAALSMHSWRVGHHLPPIQYAQKMAERELVAALDQCLAPGREAVLYMYTGSVEHAAIMARVLQGRPALAAHVNLFWSTFHDKHWDAWLAHHRLRLADLAATPRLHMTVPTERLRDALEAGTGLRLDVAPHPSTAVRDDEFPLEAADAGELASAATEPDPVRVLFPGAAIGGKGFSATLETVRDLAGGSFEPLVRWNPPAGPTDDELRERELTDEERLLRGQRALVDELPDDVAVIEGALDNDAFLGMFRSSHVSVLPYEPAAFGMRTSGLLIDSLYHGLPVVTTSGTWLGELVTRYDCGVAVDEMSAAQLRAGVERVVSAYETFTAKAREAARAYFAANSWEELARTILQSARSHPVVGPFERAADVSIDEATVVARVLLDGRGSSGTMLDVGAHHGSAAARFIEAGWRVIACEPDQANREKLVELLGSRGNVVVDPRAVSDEASEAASFFASPESTGISALHAFTEGHEESGTVAVTTVAELADEYGLEAIDFLKIDVEGFDLNVLRGVPWERLRPGAIICEFDDSKTVTLGYSFRDMAEYLSERGYSVYVSEWHPIVRYGVSHQWRSLSRYPAELGSAQGWGNLLAFAADPGAAALRAAIEPDLGAVADGPSAELTAHERAALARLEERVAAVSAAQPEIGIRLEERIEALLAAQESVSGRMPS